MFCVTLSTRVIKKKQEGSSLHVHFPSQPENICHKRILKAYCLITTPANTPIHHKALLNSIVWFTPTVPISCAKHNSDTEQAPYSDRLKSFNGMILTGYDRLNHKGTSRLRAPRIQGIHFASSTRATILQTVRLAWCVRTKQITTVNQYGSNRAAEVCRRTLSNFAGSVSQEILKRIVYRVSVVKNP